MKLVDELVREARIADQTQATIDRAVALLGTLPDRTLLDLVTEAPAPKLDNYGGVEWSIGNFARMSVSKDGSVWFGLAERYYDGMVGAPTTRAEIAAALKTLLEGDLP